MFPSRRPTGNKYGNHKVEADGIKFDSKLEAQRYLVLRDRMNKGEISGLRLQVEFQLTRKRFHIQRRYNKNGKELAPVQRLYEHASTYKADFVYDVTDASGNVATIVEDTKGRPTPDYILKRKMMLEIHNIPVFEIKRPGAPTPTIPEII